jgi:hypothetical protein
MDLRGRDERGRSGAADYVMEWNAFVGQIVNLRRIANPPARLLPTGRSLPSCTALLGQVVRWSLQTVLFGCVERAFF